MKLQHLLAGTAFAVLAGIAAGAAQAQDLVFHEGVQVAEGAAETSYPPVDKPSFKIGLSNISVVNTWRVQMIEEAKYEASLHPEIGELLITDAGGSVNKQVADIEDLIARDVDVLLVTPASDSALNGVLDKAFDAGIPVVIFESDANPNNFTTKIRADERYFGSVGAQYLVDHLSSGDKVIGLRGIAGNTTDNDRWEAAKGILEAAGIEIVDSAFGDWAYDKGKQVCESLIIAHPDINGIWSSGGAMTQGCAEVMQENGMALVPMSGEANNGFLRIWKELGLESVGPVSSTWVGAQAVIAGLKILEGEPIAKQYMLRPTPITQDQIDSFYNPDLNDSYWIGSILPEDQLKSMYGK